MKLRPWNHGPTGRGASNLGGGGGSRVTHTAVHAMEMRALMRSPDSSKDWNPRCHIREKLLGFLQERDPDGLPKTRAAIKGGTASAR